MNSGKVRKYIAALLVAALAFVGSAPAFAQTQSPMRPNSLAIDSGTKTATSVAGAVTLNKSSGVITTEALSTAALSNYTLTVTDSAIQATDTVYAVIWQGTNSTGIPMLLRVTPAGGSFVVIIRNMDTAAAFNGTLKVGFFALDN